MEIDYMSHNVQRLSYDNYNLKEESFRK